MSSSVSVDIAILNVANLHKCVHLVQLQPWDLCETGLILSLYERNYMYVWICMYMYVWCLLWSFMYFQDFKKRFTLILIILSSLILHIVFYSLWFGQCKTVYFTFWNFYYYIVNVWILFSVIHCIVVILPNLTQLYLQTFFFLLLGVEEFCA